jgi:hypothetical protein
MDEKIDRLLKINENILDIIKEIIKLQTDKNLTSDVIYTSKNVCLNDQNNWLLPVSSFNNACKACHYFGHTQKDCPNILKTYQLCCSRCWNDTHERSKCTKEEKEIPFRDLYVSPEQLIRRYMGYTKGKFIYIYNKL